jgi:Xaa-Pro aminopeptidase
MDSDLSQLDAYLDEAGVDGYLVDADGTNSDQRYLAGFGAPDPFHTLYTGRIHLLVSSLEYGRAKRQSRADNVERLADYDYHEKVEEYGLGDAKHRVVAEFLDAHHVESVAVPSRFPARAADCLRDLDVAVQPEAESVVTGIRAAKTEAEVDHIREAQRANEAAMATAERLLREADVEDGVLHYDGEPLTSERVKREIEITLIRNDCALDETIVACGSDAADPHDRGSGPLRANEPVIVDIFPQHTETKYHADMTRTFCVGEPSDTIREWYDLTQRAKEAALETVAAGVTGKVVHDAVCDVYEEAGLPTLRSDPETETGFIHSTGHGVGLDVHEQPVASPAGEAFEAGNVVTIEPGLYDPAVGGVRIEDFVVVTEDGYENLTDYEESLVV